MVVRKVRLRRDGLFGFFFGVWEGVWFFVGVFFVGVLVVVFFEGVGMFLGVFFKFIMFFNINIVNLENILEAIVM